MPNFVHIAPETALSRIRRCGIRAGRIWAQGTWMRGVYCMPVTPDFSFSHQWLRELRRFHAGRLWGVYFRLRGDELLAYGRYNAASTQGTAGSAVASIMTDPVDGVEIVVPRSIAPDEITKVKPLPQRMGWRYFPEAKSRQPCGCSYCQRGLYNSRKLREDYRLYL